MPSGDHLQRSRCAWYVQGLCGVGPLAWGLGSSDSTPGESGRGAGHGAAKLSILDFCSEPGSVQVLAVEGRQGEGTQRGAPAGGGQDR